jgi:hypothetical protein
LAVRSFVRREKLSEKEVKKKQDEMTSLYKAAKANLKKKGKKFSLRFQNQRQRK